MLALPIDAFVERIASSLRQARAVVVVAQPGAGKTTRVPPTLADDGPLILLQPRRVAARAIASRIAEERGWTIGREVGWQVRFERRFARETRLLVVTEGVLTARLQADPLLSDFRTIVFDEFHERSIHSDVAMALAKQAWRARPDLRIAVMSATLDAGPVSAFFDGCPVVDVPGRLYPVEITYAPGQLVAPAALEVLGQTAGDVLCFLPGAAEIRRAVDDIQREVTRREIDVLPLHGSLDGETQDAAIRPSSRRRIVVATNIAETSLTVPGVTAVVDSGWQKVARYDSDRAIDSLDLERISADSAEQRAGRAARQGPGVVRRLWDARDRLRPHREPDIHRVDLSAAVLDVIAWGGDPRELEWFEAPSETTLTGALSLLERLGLVDHGKLTAIGEQVRQLPLHPRLGRMLVAAGGAVEMARAAALLSERHLLPPRRAATRSDLLSALDDWGTMPVHVQRVARDIESIGSRTSSVASGPSLTALAGSASSPVASGFRRTDRLSETDFLKAVLAGYPDRVAARREPRSSRVRLGSGTGAMVGSESGVVEGEFLVALDLQAVGRKPGGTAGPSREPMIRVASVVDRDWLQPNNVELVHRFDADTGTVKAVRVDRYDALVVAEHPERPDPVTAAALLAEAWRRRGPTADDTRLLRRLRFAGQQEVDLDMLLRTAAGDARSLSDVRLSRALPAHLRHALDSHAPESLLVPTGRTVPLEYADDGSLSASVKLQELFGLGETPRIGPRKEPVLLTLLAPNGRPVQITRDLRSFWERTYPEVRKELRGRYPKHPWPEDPWTAPPTRRVKPRAREE